jgi:hypothetical protein
VLIGQKAGNDGFYTQKEFKAAELKNGLQNGEERSFRR